MNWIETIIKEYEDILNDKSIICSLDLIKALDRNNLTDGLCIRALRFSNSVRFKYVRMIDSYMESDEYTGEAGYITMPPRRVHWVFKNEDDKFQRNKIKETIQIRLTHLYKMKDLYYPTKERGITITKSK